jgi:hypothetical protein
MGHSFLYARQNTGLIWHTAVRPSVPSEYDKINNCAMIRPPFVTIESQLLSVRTVINILHFLNQLIVYMAFSKLTKITPTCRRKRQKNKFIAHVDPSQSSLFLIFCLQTFLILNMTEILLAGP